MYNLLDTFPLPACSKITGLVTKGGKKIVVKEN